MCLFLSFPRKGTETLLHQGIDLAHRAESFPIFSPQGDGNHFEGFYKYILYNVFSYLFPARGRKHGKSLGPPPRGKCLFLSFPRKGTETSSARRINPRSALSFPIFSPQGDGNTLEHSRDGCFMTVFSYLFPARGRKLKDAVLTQFL